MDLGETARQVPMVVIIVTVALLAARAFMEIYELTSGVRTYRQLNRVKPDVQQPGTSSTERPKPKLLEDVLLFLAAPACLYAMGLLAGGAVYLMVFFSAKTAWSWQSRLLVTVVFTAIMAAVSAMYAAARSIPQ